MYNKNRNNEYEWDNGRGEGDDIYKNEYEKMNNKGGLG